jgi:hypothetical protein
MAPHRRRGRAAVAAAAVPPVAAAGRPRVAAIRARVARGARAAQSPLSPRGQGGSSREREISPLQAGEFHQPGSEFVSPVASWSNPSVALSLAVSAAAVFATSAPGAADLVSSLVRQVAEGVAAGAGPDRIDSRYHPFRANPRPEQSSRARARPQCAVCRGRHGGQCYRLTGGCFRCGDLGHRVQDCPREAPPRAASSRVPQPCDFCGGFHPEPCYHQGGRCFRCGSTAHFVGQCPVAAPSRASSEVRIVESESSESSSAASGEPASASGIFPHP